MDTSHKDYMLVAVMIDKWEPWSANKCSEKYVSVLEQLVAQL